MFVLIWATLLFAVRSDDAHTDVKKLYITGTTAVAEGDVLNLTCSIESSPPTLITWTKLGSNKTDLQNDQKAILMIPNMTAEHAGQYICSAKHLNKSLTINITVTYVKKPEITGKTTVKEGDNLNLTCSVDSFPPSVITWTKLRSSKNLNYGTGSDLHNDSGMATLFIPNVTAEHAGEYICTAKHLDNTLKEEVNITVIYVKKPEVTGKTTVKEGDNLNLTCSVDSFPPSVITWTKLGSSKNLNYGTGSDLHNDRGMATLFIPNVTAEHAGEYICTAKHLDNTLKEEVNITVILLPKILNSSGCINQSGVLTCVCIIQGVPLPIIKWPLLENHTEYSSITTVSNHTVNSTIILTVKDHSNTIVECASSNGKEEIKGNLIIKKVEQDNEGQIMKLLRIMTRLEIITAFLTGVLSAIICCLAIICCWARKCHRKNKRTYGNLAETLEMMDAGQAVEDDQAIDQEAAEGGGAVAAGKSEVEYSKLDFSLIKRKSAAEAGATQGTTETEYAEIKKEKVEARQDGEGEEEEEMTGENEEAKHCEAYEREGEDMALYSSIEDVMGFEDSVA